VAALLPFAQSEIVLLTALLRAQVRFMVVSLSAATLQGSPIVTQDVDLWFEKLDDPRLAKALRDALAARSFPARRAYRKSAPRPKIRSSKNQRV